jgi:protein-S-isoprenylcysteine O-methyltransferase Ste14
VSVENDIIRSSAQSFESDDEVLNEDWILYRMVRSPRLLSLVLVAIGVGRWIQKRKMK